MWAQAFQEDGELSLKKFPELAQLRQAVRPCYSGTILSPWNLNLDLFFVVHGLFMDLWSFYGGI